MYVPTSPASCQSPRKVRKRSKASRVVSRTNGTDESKENTRPRPIRPTQAQRKAQRQPRKPGVLGPKTDPTSPVQSTDQPTFKHRRDPRCVTSARIQIQIRSARSRPHAHHTPPPRTPPTQAPDWPAGSRLPTLSRHGPSDSAALHATAPRPRKTRFWPRIHCSLSLRYAWRPGSRADKRLPRRLWVCVCALVRTPQGVLFRFAHGRSSVRLKAHTRAAASGHAMPCHDMQADGCSDGYTRWLAGWTGLAGCGGGRWWLRILRALCVADAATFASPRHATPCRQVAGSNGRCVARRDLLRWGCSRARWGDRREFVYLGRKGMAWLGALIDDVVGYPGARDARFQPGPGLTGAGMPDCVAGCVDGSGT
jgi:hypothetical protein